MLVVQHTSLLWDIYITKGGYGRVYNVPSLCPTSCCGNDYSDEIIVYLCMSFLLFHWWETTTLTRFHNACDQLKSDRGTGGNWTEQDAVVIINNFSVIITLVNSVRKRYASLAIFASVAVAVVTRPVPSYHYSRATWILSPWHAWNGFPTLYYTT